MPTAPRKTAPVKKAGPAKKPAAPPPAPLPTTKQELVEIAIDRGIPSYEAWDMTVPELTKKLEA